jgi:CubicO group peptidase (beta-lactamase class C family)
MSIGSTASTTVHGTTGRRKSTMRRFDGRRRPATAARFAAAGLLVLATASGARAQEPFPGLEAYIANAVAEWGVPGLSVAIVRNDSVLYARGFGVVGAGSDRRVDEHTLFEIGSAGKAFTGAVVALLVSDGVLRFDDRVSQHLPEFRLADPVANAEVTLRDALTHRSGITRGELIWLGSGATRAEILERVRHLQPQSPFRSRFSYQNILYLAAGEAAGRAAGSTWDELVERRIFAPLGMTSSAAATAGLTGANAATPHGSERDSAFVKPLLDMTNIGPAGSIVSNARDMAQWLRFQLGDGEFEGTRLMEPAAFREMHTPQIVLGAGAASVGQQADRLTRFNTYGLGWFVQDYRRALLVQHGGNTDGMTSAVGMLPEEKFGVVVLSNLAGSPLPGLLSRWIFDRQLGAPMQDHVGEARARLLTQRARADSIAAAGGASNGARREPAGPSPLPLSAYTGTYADGLHGEAVVSLEDGRLQLRRGSWYGPLEYWNGTNFRWTIFPSSPINPLFLKFEVAPDDQVTGLWFGIGDDATLMRRQRTAPEARGG